MADKPSTQIAGIGSGINWQDTIDQLMQIERQPVVKKQSRLSELNSKNSAWDAINTQLNSFKTTLQSMDTTGELMVKRASSSDSSVLTVSANENASQGTFDVSVNQLADAHRLMSDGFATLSTSMFSADGTFTYKVGADGKEISLNVTTSTSISDLKRMINAQSKGDISASIMNDGDATNPYRLILTSKKTGESNEIIIGGTATYSSEFRDQAIASPAASASNTGTSALNSHGIKYSGSKDSFTFTATTGGTVGSDGIVSYTNTAGTITGTIDFSTITADQKIAIADGLEISFNAGSIDLNDQFTIATTDPTARDSEITVNNIAITKDSNTVTDVIEGVTLNLQKLSDTGETTKITIDNDNAGVTGLINNFVNSYNSVTSTIKGYTKWDEELKKGGVLFGESTASDITNQLSMLISSMNAGLDENQVYKTLSQVGLNLKDGKLSLDSTKLSDALKNNYDEVIKLFTLSTEFTGTNSDKFQYRTSNYDTLGGNYDINAVVSGGKVVSATINGKAATIKGDYFFEGSESDASSGLMLSVDTTTDGSYSGKIRFSTGKNVELINKIQSFVNTDPTEQGEITIAKSGNNSAIENINKQIDSMEERLERTRKMMEKKWLAMENAVSKMKSQSARNSAMLG